MGNQVEFTLLLIYRVSASHIISGGVGLSEEFGDSDCMPYQERLHLH